MENGLSFIEIAQKLTELHVDFYDGTRFLPLSQVMYDLQRTYTRSAISTVELYEQIADIANAYSSRADASAHPRFDEIFPRDEVQAFIRRLESAIYDTIRQHTGNVAATINTTDWWLRNPYSYTLPCDTGWCTTAIPTLGINFPMTDTRVQGTSATQYSIRNELNLSDLGDLLQTNIRAAQKNAQKAILHHKPKDEAPDWTELDNFLSGMIMKQKGVRDS